VGPGRSGATLQGSSSFVQGDEGTRASGASSFGQIPTYEEGDLALFETGAIVFHIAERHAGLLPDHANDRGRAITWMFAALKRRKRTTPTFPQSLSLPGANR